MKQLVQMPVRSLSAPKAIGRTKPPRPPIMPTRPPTAPTLFGIVDRDVLVDRRLAQAHEEAEHENQAGEGDDAGRHMKVQRAIDALHDIFGGRIGQDEGDQCRYAEHPVHDAAGAIAVGENAAIDAEQTGRNRIGGAQHAGSFDVELVDADQVARQPQRQRDKGAEGKEIIERETPDLDVLQRLELEPGAARPFAFGAARQLYRVLLGEEPEHDAHQRDGRGPDLRGCLPAIGDQHERRAELGHRRADIAGAENTKGGALFLRRIPARHIGDADREGAAGDTDAERRDQDLDVGMGVDQQEGRDRGRQHDHRVNSAAAILVGPDAEEDAHERAGEDRRADQEAELRLVKAELLLNLNADDGEDGPHREAHGERDGGHPECAALACDAGDRFRLHDGARSCRSRIIRNDKTRDAASLL